MQTARQKLPMDNRKRITLTKVLHEGEEISSFEAYREGDRIILIPLAEIPARELWLYQDQEKLASVKRGLARGKVIERGSFAEHADEDI